MATTKAARKPLSQVVADTEKAVAAIFEEYGDSWCSGGRADVIRRLTEAGLNLDLPPVRGEVTVHLSRALVTQKAFDADGCFTEDALDALHKALSDAKLPDGTEIIAEYESTDTYFDQD